MHKSFFYSSRFISLAVVAMVVATMVSCYKITLLQQSHKTVRGGVITGKMVVKGTNTNDNGEVKPIYGLFGVRIPIGWEVDGTIVMTQVPKFTTDLGDDEYNSIIKRQLVFNQQYTDLLNADYPKDGYIWVGYATKTDFKSMFNNKNRSLDVDSIYVTFEIATSEDKTGVYYLDYVAGQINADQLNNIGVSDRDWNTRVATFAGNNINNVYYTDTRVVVTNADGSYDYTNDEYAKPSEWQLEPMHNSTALTTVSAYKDCKYNALFTRTRGWNGGDGVLTVGLPNGDVFWTFNDSFYGVVDAKKRARGSCSFPRNSIMVQKAHDGVLGETDADLVWLADYVNWKKPQEERYFHARTHLRHPEGEKTDAEIAAGDIDQGMVYWSGDGTIYDGKLQMIWIGTKSDELRNTGTALATYSLTGSEPKGYYLDEIPDYLPKAGNYLHLEHVKHNVNSNSVSYGSTLWEDEDGHTYLYGANSTDMVVARTATHDLYSAWQYYVKNTDGTWVWQDNYPDAITMKRSNVVTAKDGAIMLPWVFKKGDWYFMTSQAPVFSPNVYIYRSKYPWGPFDERKLLFRLPDKLDKLGSTKYHWLYMVNLHPALSREGELVFSTNSDADSFWDNFNEEGSADFYRPFFYRVFGWETLYPDMVDTGIDGGRETHVSSIKSNTVYNLYGMPVKKPTHGIYIINGKKVFVK